MSRPALPRVFPGLFVFVVLLMSGAGTADVPAGERSWTVGVRLGLGQGWIGGEDYQKFMDDLDVGIDFFPAYIAGIVAERGVHPNLAVQFGFGHAARGGEATLVSLGGSDIDATHEIGSLEISALLKPRIPLGRWMLYGLAGPQVVYLQGDLEETIKTGPGGIFETEGSTERSSYEVDNQWIPALALGVGTEIWTANGEGVFFLDLVYSRTFVSFSDDRDWFFNYAAAVIGYRATLGQLTRLF